MKQSQPLFTSVHSFYKSVEMLDSIDVLWKNNSVDGRKRVPKALIKSPIAYDRKKRQYRTSGLIDFVRLNPVLARVSEDDKNEIPSKKLGILLV